MAFKGTRGGAPLNSLLKKIIKFSKKKIKIKHKKLIYKLRQNICKNAPKSKKV